jgi:hypothetical protein
VILGRRNLLYLFAVDVVLFVLANVTAKNSNHAAAPSAAARDARLSRNKHDRTTLVSRACDGDASGGLVSVDEQAPIRVRGVPLDGEL